MSAIFLPTCSKIKVPPLSQRRQEAWRILLYIIFNGFPQVPFEGVLVYAFKGNHEIVTALGLLRYVHHALFIVALYVELNPLLALYNRGVPLGDWDLVAHIGPRCGLDPLIQALGRLLFECLGHLIKGTVYLEGLYLGAERAGHGLSEIPQRSEDGLLRRRIR